MRNYEAVFVFDPELKEDALSQISEKVTNIIESSGRLIKKDVWGKRKLSYPIKKKTEGIYNLFYFSGDENIPAELKRFTIINEKVLRSIVIAKDKTAFDNMTTNIKEDKPVVNDNKEPQVIITKTEEEVKIQEDELKIQVEENSIQENEQLIQTEEQNIQVEEKNILETEDKD